MGHKIQIGTGPQGGEIDLEELLKSRLLLQANSGGGKSWCLRRISEQLFGHVPITIIDPEGEFATLREKFDFILVGKGGETPAFPPSASHVAEKLLELRASAVCDIYELKPHERHRWVRLFLEAIIDAPKNLWHPRIIIVDEAHIFAPEKGQGESEAFGSMVDLATRGRKRGLSAVFATQRLSKLAKNATAELLNRLVGPTFEDLDLDRAADILSVARGGRDLFNREMKTLPPGNFYGLGRAISKEMIKIQVGPVITTHPEMGTYTMEPPPTPEKIRSLLPMLADLPKMAEEKVRTEAELRGEIRALKVQLTDRPEVLPQKTEVLEIPIIKDDELKKLEELTALVDKKIVEFGDVGKLLSAAAASLHGMISQAIGPQGVKDLVLKAAMLRGNLRPPPSSPAVRAPDLFLNPLPAAAPVVVPPVAVAPAALAEAPVENAPAAEPEAADPFVLSPAAPQEPVSDQAAPTAPSVDAAAPVPVGELTRPQKAVLRALAEFLVIEVNKPSRHQVAGWLGIKVSGSFLNNLGALRARGLVNYDGMKLIITNEGLKEAPPIEVKPTSEDIFTHLLEAVSAPQQAMLKLLRENGGWMSRDDLARSLGVQVTGSFMNNLATLHTAELLDYGEGDMKKFVKIADWTMLSGNPAA